MFDEMFRLRAEHDMVLYGAAHRRGSIFEASARAAAALVRHRRAELVDVDDLARLEAAAAGELSPTWTPP